MIARLALVAALAAGPVWAGDASGFDPAAIDQCLAAAPTQGAKADCAGIGMDACVSYAKDKYTGDDPNFTTANCLDASHQAWEAQLGSTYETVMKAEGQKGIKPQEMLRQAEYSWLKFREDLCNQARDAAPEGKGDLAASRCMRDETARQNALLLSIGAGG